MKAFLINCPIVTAVILLTAITPSLLRSELKWEAPEQKMKWKEDQASTPFQFRAGNTGTTPIRIIEAASGCNCVWIKPFEPFTLKPGETWKLEGTYASMGRQGPQLESILVAWKDETRQRSRLKLFIELPLMTRAEPDVLRWSPADQTPQTTLLEWLGPGKASLRPQSQPPSEDDWKTRITELQKGKKWRVTCTPPENASPGMHQIPFAFHQGEDGWELQVIALVDEP